jgi:hypothetical protein
MTGRSGDPDLVGTPRIVRVGGLSRADLRSALAAAGVRLNQSAETLLDDPLFDGVEAGNVQTLAIVVHTVGQLGLADGTTLPLILAAARERRLTVCPPFTGPYLRLAVPDQPSAPDSVMSSGRPPSGAVHVASERLRDEDDYPRGFYLRVVDGTSWLRGYRCSDDAPWSSGDLFAFVSGESLPAAAQ